MKNFLKIIQCTFCFAIIVAMQQNAGATTCASAINIPSIPVTGQSLVCGGADDLSSASVPVACGGATNSYKGGQEALYTFTPSASGNYIVSIAGQTWTSIFVYAGCPTSGGTCVNSVGTSATSKSLTVSMTAGTQYFIWFDTWPTPTSPCPGTFSLIAAPPPPSNDECSGAISLTVGSSCTFTGYTNADASGSAGVPAPGCANYSGGDVWFSAVVPAGGRLVIDALQGVVTDGGMAIYSGTCGSLTLLECDDDDSVNGLMPIIDRSDLTPGSTIYIRFWEYGNDNPGTFSICAYNPAPPCAAPGAPSASSVTTTSATLSWASAMGAISYDWTIGTGVSCPTGTGGNTAGTSVNLTGLIPNTTYRFCVRTSNCGGGEASSYMTTTFTTDPHPNDACSGAITVTCGSTTNGSTIGATSDSGIGSCGSGTGGIPNNGVWYRFVGNGAQANISLCGSSYDTKLHVYTGTCGSLTCLVSNDDNDDCGSGSTRSQVIFNANVGTEYFILVSGFGSSTGTYSLNISCLCGPNLSYPWTVSNIGSSTGEGIDNVCNGTIDISSKNIGTNTSDVLTFASQQLCGNFTICAKLNSVTNQGWGGLMVRENSAPGSKKVALRTQLTNIFVRDLRTATNGVEAQQQYMKPGHTYMRLVRTGNTFIGYTSANGIAYQQIFAVNLVLPNCVDAGLFTQSINAASTALAAFSNLCGFSTGYIPFTDQNTSNRTIDSERAFTVYPNPAASEINVKWISGYTGKAATITVTNQLGQVVATQQLHAVTNEVESINISQLADGMYILSVQTEDKQTQFRKFMVNGLRP